MPATTRHPRFVRITHWLTTLAFFALLLSGVEILLSHPRFYWGETGNVNMPPLFTIPVPSSRSSVPTGYGWGLPDENGWSRYLHFQAAWLVLFTAAVYLIVGLWTRHFRRNLFPGPDDRSLRALGRSVVGHLRFDRSAMGDVSSYNTLQRLSYLLVLFVLFPLMIWTGLAMAPAFTAVFPSSVAMLGGKQSARTLHFFVTIALVAFTLVHMAMVVLAGFRARMRGMVTGTTEVSE